MKKLKNMKDSLINAAMYQINNIHEADCKELGEAIDMIKDLSEAMYYCSIVEAMEKSSKNGNGWEKMEDKNVHYYSENPTVNYRDSQLRNGNYPYREKEYPIMDLRDRREGKSPMSRKMYMESKEMNKDKLSHLKDLETYMRELSDDITEMIEGASPEEKQLLQKKLNMLAQKITSD